MEYAVGDTGYLLALHNSLVAAIKAHVKSVRFDPIIVRLPPLRIAALKDAIELLTPSLVNVVAGAGVKSILAKIEWASSALPFSSALFGTVTNAAGCI